MSYRTNGAVGAILDEYEKAINELKKVIHNLSPMHLITIVDYMTDDKDCQSIQKILNHVISSGYSYVVQIRNSKGKKVRFPDIQLYDNSHDFQTALTKMFEYNVIFFDDYNDLDLNDYQAHRFTTTWGNQYDIEQLFEHAIVHILRHRRQIERFKLILKVQK